MRNSFLSVVVALCACTLVGCTDIAETPKDDYTMETLLGSWTDPKGEPGNSIIFHEQRVELGVHGAGIEGLVTAEKIAGVDKKTTARWNWESWEPVRVNLVLPNVHIAAVKAIDHNHLKIKFGADYKSVVNTNLATDPTALTLTRTTEKLPVPTVDKPFGAPGQFK